MTAKVVITGDCDRETVVRVFHSQPYQSDDIPGFKEVGFLEDGQVMHINMRDDSSIVIYEFKRKDL